MGNEISVSTGGKGNNNKTTRSSRLLQEEFPELKKRYWGQHLWARGYFCTTVGNVDEEVIKNYVENQVLGNDNNIFKITERV